MTIQQLRYIIVVAETGSITEASRKLFISQPPLSEAIKEVEEEIQKQIFKRSQRGISLTADGVEFLAYARQAVSQMDIIEDKYVNNVPDKLHFAVATQHYMFSTNAMVDLINELDVDRYEILFHETQTHRVIENVKSRFCDLGILYKCKGNKTVLEKELKHNKLVFTELFTTNPCVFIRYDHPLAKKKTVTFRDLEKYPRINYNQGVYESAYYSEEPYYQLKSDKVIKVGDRAAAINMMLGIDAYTISTGIMPRWLHNGNIVSIPLECDEYMQIGYIVRSDERLSELGKKFIDKILLYTDETVCY